MVQASLKAACVAVLGSFAWIGLAQAAAPLPLNFNTTLLILAADEENEAVLQDLQPDLAPPGGEAGKREETPNAPSASGPWGRARAISRIRNSGTIWKPA